MNDDAEIRRAVRRTVGIAALRRLRRMVEADNALEAEKERRAWQLSIFFILAAALVLAWIVIR
ncbi:MAG: hypothetical protein WCI19_08400 [Betaproteobacteria bacterium]|nr:hypothetical protein [Rhodocyclales bacterium]